MSDLVAERAARGFAGTEAPSAPAAAAEGGLKVLIYGLNYKPEMIGVGKYSGELAEGLAGFGHEVRVVTAFPYYPQWRVSRAPGAGLYASEKEGAIAVTRCPLYVPRRPTQAKRLLHLASWALSSGPVALAAALRQRPDVVLAVMPTLFAAPLALLAARLTGARAWLHVQDLEVDAALETGLLGRPLARLALAAERWLLRRFDRISTISPEMRLRLQAKLATAGEARSAEAGPAEVALLPNWVDSDEIRPLDDPAAARAGFGIPPGAFVALYAGNMNRKQGLEVLPALVRRLADAPDLLFVLAGEGPMRPELEAALAGEARVRFLPLQPAERFNDLLNCADVHLLPQRPEVAGLLLPSKLAPMQASGRPTIAVAPPGSAVEEAVEGRGIVLPTLDPVGLAAALQRLMANAGERHRLGAAARRRAVEVSGRDGVVGRFHRALAVAALQRGRPARAGVA